MDATQAYLASFDHDPRYLDWAALGPISPRARAASSEMAERLGTATPGSSRDVAATLTETKHLLASLLARDADEVTFQPSTGYGLQQAIAGLSGGVLAARSEFPAVTTPIQRASESLGRVRPQWLDPVDGLVTPDLVREGITAETTALVVSLVDFRTGYRTDLHGLRDVLGPDRLLIVDAVQGFGITENDLAVADVVCGNGYKWLRAGRATGFAVFSERARQRIDPVLSGSAGMQGALVLDEVREPASGAAAFTVSQPDPVAVARLHAALTELVEVGMAVVAARVADRAERVIAAADEAGVEVRTPRDPAHRAGIVTLAPRDVDAVSRALAEAGFTTTTRSGTVRLAAHAGTSDDTLAELGEVLAGGR